MGKRREPESREVTARGSRKEKGEEEEDEKEDDRLFRGKREGRENNAPVSCWEMTPDN